MKQSATFSQATDEIFKTVMSGLQWYVAPGETLTLSFSFIGPNLLDASELSGYSDEGSRDEPFRDGFQALSEYYQNIIRTVFSNLESAINIVFTEAENPAEADIRIGVTNFGEDREHAAAYAFLPWVEGNYSQSSEGIEQPSSDRSGDIWIDSGWLAGGPADAWFVGLMTHEIGHSLGLGHPHEEGYRGSFSTDNILNDVNLDYEAYTMMSYNQWPEDIEQNQLNYWTAAQTLMPLDIDALQYMYGVSQKTQDNTYVVLAPTDWYLPNINSSNPLGPEEGYYEYLNGYTSIADPGGYNELILRFNEDADVDLRPGSWTYAHGGYEMKNGYVDPSLYIHETTIISKLVTGRGDDTVTASDFGVRIETDAGSDTVYGGLGNDDIDLGSGNDFYYGHAGNDILFGGAGTDTMDFQSVALSHYRFEFGREEKLTAVNLLTQESMDLDDVESLIFDGDSYKIRELQDDILALGMSLIEQDHVAYYLSDIDSEGGSVSADDAQLYRTYMGGLGRAPDSAGFDWWQGKINSGEFDLNELAARFIDSEEFRSLADQNDNGQIDNAEFLDHVYTNVLGREPDAAGYNWWLGKLNSGDFSQSEAFNNMTQSDEYVLLTANTVSDWLFIEA